jgi:hypothetical protein
MPVRVLGKGPRISTESNFFGPVVENNCIFPDFFEKPVAFIWQVTQHLQKVSISLFIPGQKNRTFITDNTFFFFKCTVPIGHESAEKAGI